MGGGWEESEIELESHKSLMQHFNAYICKDENYLTEESFANIF